MFEPYLGALDDCLATAHQCCVCQITQRLGERMQKDREMGTVCRASEKLGKNPDKKSKQSTDKSTKGPVLARQGTSVGFGDGIALKDVRSNPVCTFSRLRLVQAAPPAGRPYATFGSGAAGLIKTALGWPPDPKHETILIEMQQNEVKPGRWHISIVSKEDLSGRQIRDAFDLSENNGPTVGNLKSGSLSSISEPCWPRAD